MSAPRKHPNETPEEREARHEYYRERRRASRRRSARRELLGRVLTLAPLLVLAAVVVGMLVWGFSRSEPSADVNAALPSSAPSANEAVDNSPLVMDVLSDSQVYNANSWFRQTVASGTVPGVVAGRFASFPGGDIATVREGLDQVDGAELVLVSAGTNDVLGGVEPDEVLARLQALVADVDERADRVVLSLLPPSDDRPDAVAETNRLIEAWADTKRVEVVDVYSAVTDGTGAWEPGLSGDGVHANDNGAAIMARAAEQQLRAVFD